MTPGISFTLEAQVLKAWYVEDVPQLCFAPSDNESRDYCKALKSCKANAIEFAPEFVNVLTQSLLSSDRNPLDLISGIEYGKIYPVPPELNIEKQYQYMTNHWTVLTKYEWDKYGENVRKRVVMILQSSVKREDKPKSHKAKLEEEVKTLKFEKECADDEYVQLRREYELLKEQLKAADEVIEWLEGFRKDGGWADGHTHNKIDEALEKYNSLKST